MSSSGIQSMDLPPVIPSLDKLVEQYLLDFESLPIHDPVASRKFYPRIPDPTQLLSPIMSMPMTDILVERDPASGIITGVTEIFDYQSGTTAKNSFSLKRAPGPPEEAVRGSSTNFPFWPGGIPEPVLIKDSNQDGDLFDPKCYLTAHPKLSKGIDFGCTEVPEQEIVENQLKKEGILNLTDVLNVDIDALNIFEPRKLEKKKADEISADEQDVSLIKSIENESSFKSKNSDVIRISDGPSFGKVNLVGTEWAVNIDVNSPVDDFTTRVPNPACSYPFELDTFQKQAIVHLENHNSVFVAAHTSAGKTVVAEYAIALSLKHMTRAIYTSPIKALSNQKYRELKTKFEDVGLLTGDIQINPKASCIIMTTEILQSMLYNGSDIIRDLEWVIFDEVHYINNAERGHVWEEVIIMLPAHVNIVLLSATVPNTVEFADWIGRIKRKKIYVISTTKRPVPLEHFLYTGVGGKTKDEVFKIVDANGNFIKQGYMAAVNAKKEREKKSSQAYGSKQQNIQFLGDKQEKNLWVGLLDHLGKRELLPVVAFTLSKKMCDQNAILLESQDLTTSKEKHQIHLFIKKCTDRLKGGDKNLPQVKHMSLLLTSGIGVHHSGILPLLKEMVEMLFARGLVKLLFATETFAMGVNMPARCVVFSSIRKHDGVQFRDFVPSEYIQMAGRAGRRGLDTTGTVMLLCKGDVYEMADLHQMMLGKPTKLESQFKLTYSMILNLLRVEVLRVEDMMKRSFSESLQLRNQSKYEDSLRALEKENDVIPQLECIMCQQIDHFYALTRDFVNARDKMVKIIYTHPNFRKLLQPGRVVKLSYNQFQNSLACIVHVDARDATKYKVFLLVDDAINDANLSKDDILMRTCLSVSTEKLNILETVVSHEIFVVGQENIASISKKNFKISGDRIIDNVEKRKIPRFKDDPPSQSVAEIIKEMQRLNENGGETLEFYDFLRDSGIKDIDVYNQLTELEVLDTKVKSSQCLECPQFVEHFSRSFKKLKITEDIANTKYLMSEEALLLHPEYQMRIEVLKKLGYIEDNQTVTLKGRVACEMGNHELIVTELLLENIFADKPIEETTSLLSSLVFQQKRYNQPSLNEEVKKGIKVFQNIARKIGETQKECGLKETVGDFVDQFNFGLAEVVYHWTLGMEFDKIMELTDVQEGITVKCIQRLSETLKDVRNAARIIGDPSLYEEMEKASTAIKRDIVFAASLYTQ